VVVYRDLLFIEHVVQEEEVMLSHKGYRVDEAATVQEGLKVVVLFVLLNLFFKLVDIEVALSMPLLFLKFLHSLERVFSSEAGIQIVFSSLKRFVVNEWKDV
jgi:hypothetical protein